jgi:acyl-CoA thioesterase-1
MPPAPLVLALGDSLVAGYGLPAEDGFPAQLQRRLRQDHPSAGVINAGRSGDTSGDVRQRLGTALSRLPARPDLAIVQIGPNDVLRQTPPATTHANLAAILIELERCAIPTLLTTVAPPQALRDRAAPYLTIHRDLAADHRVRIHPFFPDGVLGRADMVLADRVHPNAAAITRVVDGLFPVVLEMLDAQSAGGAGQRVA